MEVASIYAFRYRPESFFDWMRPLAHHMLAAQPNPAHQALAALEGQGLIKAIITQNIDGLHQRAGSCNVVEVHGHMREAVCVRCYKVYPSEQYLDAFLNHGQVPYCPACRGVLKPNVILMGEQLPAKAVLRAQQEIRACDVLLIAGSSLEVIPVADWPDWAHLNGAHLIIVNLQATHMDGKADVIVHADVADALPSLALACQTYREHAND